MDAALSDKAALEGFSVNTLQRIVRSCLDIIRCPVCLEPVSQTAVLCVNDHLLCQDCRVGLSECPTCRQPFCETKPSRLVLQMIEALPNVCKYKGCGRLLEPEDNHELYCSFRVTECKRCEWTGCVKDLVDHVKIECCIEDIWDNAKKHKHAYWPSFDPLKEYNDFSLIVFDKYLFWEEVVNNPEDKKFNITYHFEPNGKPEENVYLKIKFESDKSRYSSKIKLSLDPEQSSEYNTFCVPWHTLPDYMADDDNIHYSYTLSKKKCDTS